MRVLILASFSGICLDETGVVEVVHPVERVCRNEDDAGIGVNLPLSIPKLDGLKDYRKGAKSVGKIKTS